MPKFSQAYLDSLFSSRDYDKLVELSGYLQDGLSRGEPTYGYPQPVFVFLESLIWFAQAMRSGVVTYYEATPKARQEAMLDALERSAPSGFATYYALGMQGWQDERKIEIVDLWMESHDEENSCWLWHLVNEHRDTIERLCGQFNAPIPDAGPAH
jgi:hypothetical protein